MSDEKREKLTPFGILLASGLEKAFLGVGRRCGQEDVAVYSIQKAELLLADKVMTADGKPNKREGKEYLEAILAARAYLEANSIGCWVGDMTPMWVETMTMEEFKELVPGIEVSVAEHEFSPEQSEGLQQEIEEILDAKGWGKAVQVH